MYATELAQYLHERLGKIGYRDDTMQRFEALRSHGLLPRGRENAAVRLTDQHIASALMGFVSEEPRDAGHVALCLGKLLPVGGVGASFDRAENVMEALSRLVGSRSAAQPIVFIEFSIGRQTHGDDFRARFLINESQGRRSISFVSSMATRSTVEGADADYDHEGLATPIVKRLILGTEFFTDLARSVDTSRVCNQPFREDWRDYQREEDRRDFHRRLGALANSSFLNMAVETLVNWPREPTRLKFAGHHFVLFPKTKDYSHSISIDLVAERLTAEEAKTLINRLLSIMSWCDDQFAILGYGWSGNAIPVPVPMRDVPFCHFLQLVI